MSKFLPIALLLTLSLTACGPRLKVPTEPPPASIRSPCPKLPLPPVPLIDPARSYWEEAMIKLYGDCAARAAATGKGSD